MCQEETSRIGFLLNGLNGIPAEGRPGAGDIECGGQGTRPNTKDGGWRGWGVGDLSKLA